MGAARYTAANYWGYGTERKYVAYMIKGGVSPYDVAAALGLSLAELALRYPDEMPKEHKQVTSCNNGELRSKKTWTRKEEQVVRDYYPTHGATWEGWLELLGDRSYAAIQRKAHNLGVHRMKGFKNA